MIQLDFRSRSPTPTPSVLRNPTPTPPKNLRLLATPTPTPQPCSQDLQNEPCSGATDIAHDAWGFQGSDGSPHDITFFWNTWPPQSPTKLLLTFLQQHSLLLTKDRVITAKHTFYINFMYSTSPRVYSEILITRSATTGLKTVQTQKYHYVAKHCIYSISTKTLAEKRIWRPCFKMGLAQVTHQVLKHPNLLILT